MASRVLFLRVSASSTTSRNGGVVFSSLAFHRFVSWSVRVLCFSSGVRFSVFRVVVWLGLIVFAGFLGVPSRSCVIVSFGLVVCFAIVLYSPCGSIMTIGCWVLLPISSMIMVAVWVFPAPSMAVMSVCPLVRSSASR